jgi:hypothetical protein
VEALVHPQAFEFKANQQKQKRAVKRNGFLLIGQKSDACGSLQPSFIVSQPTAILWFILKL